MAVNLKFCYYWLFLVSLLSCKVQANVLDVQFMILSKVPCFDRLRCDSLPLIVACDLKMFRNCVYGKVIGDFN